MREAMTQQLAWLPPISNVTDLLLNRVKSDPDVELYRVEDAQGWSGVSARQFLSAVQSLARGLIAQGLRPGDPVAIYATTSFTWTLADVAISYAGGVVVPLLETAPEEQLAWMLKDARVRFAFADSAERRERLARLSRRPSVRGGRKRIIPVYSFGEDCLEALHPQKWVEKKVSAQQSDAQQSGAQRLAGEPRTVDGACAPASIATLMRDGASVSDARLQAARSSRVLADTASIVYNADTEHKPKGCLVTHANLALFAVNIQRWLAPIFEQKGARTVLFLPLAHVLVRVLQWGCLSAGVSVAYSAPDARVREELRSLQPTFLLAVPSVFEKAFDSARSLTRRHGPSALFDGAFSTAVRYSRACQQSAVGQATHLPRLLALRHWVFDKLVYRFVREALGGELRSMLTGPNALNPELAHFFRGAGIEVLEGYGLTETTAACTVNLPGMSRIGTVGTPVPGTEIRLGEHNEIQVKGLGVFSGYHNNPQANTEAFTEGYFRTGDSGAFDEHGFLRVTGRISGDQRR